MNDSNSCLPIDDDFADAIEQSVQRSDRRKAMGKLIGKITADEVAIDKFTASLDNLTAEDFIR